MSDKGKKKNESWCTIIIEGNRTRASLEHIGRGRFRIIEHKDNSKYVGRVIDASDILNCLT